MRTLAVLALALGLTACDAFGDDDSFRVDLTPGVRLEYAVTETKDYADGAYAEAAWTSTAEVVALDAAVGEERGLVEILLTSSEGGDGRVWYRADGDRLAEVAYDGDAADGALRTVPTAGSPTLPRPVRRLLADRMDAASGRGRLVVRDEPRVVLDYGAGAGRDWVHYDFTTLGFPLRSLRRVEGEQTVETEAGPYDCLVVRSTVEFAGVDQGVDWVDYIADVGLVRRVVVVRDAEADADGNETGRETVTTMRQELTAVVR